MSEELPTTHSTPESEPVTMPELPLRKVIHTTQQLKAIGDPIRTRILGIIQQQPATAKQIADRLNMAPGTISHHLQVLENAGLAQIVARRVVHGIVAKYYTRTARIFVHDFSPDIAGDTPIGLRIINAARDELAETLTAHGDAIFNKAGFPHARLSPERVRDYEARILQLVEDFLQEPADPNGQIYGLCTAFFLAPPYLQAASTAQNIQTPTATDSSDS